MSLDLKSLISKLDGLLYLFRGKKSRKKSDGIRNVLIGVRPRVIIGFSLIFLLIISVLMVFTYLTQLNIVLTEKFNKASSVSAIIGNVPEFLLEKSLVVSQLERESQRNFIVSVVENFFKLNSEVVQVVVVNESGKIVLNSGSNVVTLRRVRDKIKGNVKKQFHFDLRVRDKQNDTKEYKVIVHPIVQSSGLMISVNDDFDHVIRGLHEKGLSSKDQEYYYLRDMKSFYLRSFLGRKVDFMEIFTSCLERLLVGEVLV